MVRKRPKPRCKPGKDLQPRFHLRRRPPDIRTSGIYGFSGPDSGAAFTIWVAVPSTWLCPADSRHDHGLRPLFGGDGQYPGRPPPIDPATGKRLTIVPVADYAGSFGDNYCGGPIMGGLPWETYPGTKLPPGRSRIGWLGYWGTIYGDEHDSTSGRGSLRGFFDYITLQTVSLNSVLDGTSQSLMVGEVLPYRAADSNFWYFNGATAGTTVPLNWNSNSVPAKDPACLEHWQEPSAPLGCRFSAAAKGFASEHPGGANFLFADGSVKFIKQSIELATYCALGSRNGVEVVGADPF